MLLKFGINYGDQLTKFGTNYQLTNEKMVAFAAIEDIILLRLVIFF